MALYFKRCMLQQHHTEYSGINESPGQDSAYRVIVGPPLQRLKRMSNECGFDSHRGHKNLGYGTKAQRHKGWQIRQTLAPVTQLDRVLQS